MLGIQDVIGRKDEQTVNRFLDALRRSGWDATDAHTQDDLPDFL